MEKEESTSIEFRYSITLDFAPKDNFRIEQDGILLVSRLHLETTGKFNDGALYVRQTINGDGISDDRSRGRGCGGSVAIVYSTPKEENGPRMVKMQPREAPDYVHKQHTELVALIESAYSDGRVLPDKLGSLIHL